MKYLGVYITFLVMILCSFKIMAQNDEKKAVVNDFVVQLKSERYIEKFSLQNYYLQFLEDPTSKLSFQEISKPDFKGFASFADFGKPFKPFTDYWIKFSIQNIEKVDAQWILFLGYLSDVEIYVQYADGVVIRQYAGFFTPNYRLSPNENAEVKTSILSKAQSKQTLFIKFKNTLNYPPEPDLALQSETSWQKQMNLTNLIQGIFHGLLWMILLYNLFLFIAIGDLTYFYYVLYVFFVSVYFLNEYEYIEEYFLPRHPHISFYMGNLIYVALVFYVQFNRLYLNTRKYRFWDFVARFWLMVSIVFMLVSVPLAYYVFPEYILVRNYYHIFYMVMILIFILFALGINNAVATFFVFGNFCVMAGGVFIIMANMNIIPFSLYYLLGAIAAELFVFTLALSYRYRSELYQKERTQVRLIEQLKENESLQQKVNRELEQKVQERTQEIAYQHQLLAERQKEIEMQNVQLHDKSQELEKSYQKITDSIRYSKRLQQAILGDESQIQRLFSDSFIIFRPKDIVSGDFYWTAQINHFKIIVAADCTGHGVPGALMTMLGSSFLNQIVNEDRVFAPDQILYELDDKVRSVQTATELKTKDGMDLIVLTFDEISHTVQFAGAMNPLYYVRDFELHQIKASPSPIGPSINQQSPKNFQLHALQYREDDIFYLCSDGFQDQFGGENGTKYLKKRFRELLLKISHLPMSEQKRKLEDEFLQWKAAWHQTDDVLVIGIKI